MMKSKRNLVLAVLALLAITGLLALSGCKNDTVSPEADTPKTYTVSFDKNAEDATGEMESQTFTEGVTQKLPANAFKRDNYTFSGWSENKTASAADYKDKDEFTATKDTCLYAVWEANVPVVIEGTTATLDIPELATSTMVENAVTEALAANATLLMINGQPTDVQQTAIAAALTGKTDIALVMGGVTAPATAITELTGIDLAYKNGTGENAYAVASDGTHIITGKAGLDAWRTAASSDASTNLTLACDIEYNANWSMLDISYSGTIDGNGYSIVGLNCSTTSQRTAFVNTLGSEGVFKHLGMVGGSFSRSRSSSFGGSAVFLWVNNGIIMGCYNTSSCTCPGGENEYSGYASGISDSNYGKIIACYNAGTISAACDPGSGINRYNKGVISSCYNTGEVSGYGESLGYAVAAITSANYATINDCYYTRPSTGFENKSSGTATNITKVNGNDWTAAMNTMNAAIEAYNADDANTVKCNYRYVLNTDAATKSAQPLVIVEASTTE